MLRRGRSLAWLFLVCAVCSLVGQASARELRIGIYQNPPKLFVDASGKPAGILVEVLDEIAARERWQLSYVSCEWLDCLQRLDDGRIDLMPDVAFTEARAARFDFHRTVALHS